MSEGVRPGGTYKRQPQEEEERSDLALKSRKGGVYKSSRRQCE